jgi:outer membrane protein assembly factor BamB
MVGWRLLPWTLSIFILPAIVKLAFGNSLPTASIQAKYPVTALAQDEGSPAVYAAFGGHLIQQIDFGNPSSHGATLVKDFMTALVVDGRSAYYTSRYAGHVGRVDLRTKRTLWIHSVARGVQSPVLIDGRVVITSPVTGAVEELSATDGHVVARRTLPGTPYGVAASGGRLYVTLARTDQVAELDANTLAPLATVKVPNGPRDIFAQGSHIWVLCALAHKLILLDTRPVGSPPVGGLWLSVQNPSISSAAGWLSIEGQEWITVLSPNGQLTRIPLALPGTLSMVAQSDGSVVVGYGSGEIDKLGPVKS